MWQEPHTHPSDWSPDGALLAGTQHAPGGANRIVICGVADQGCRVVTRATSPKWSPQGDRLYFVRPAATGRSQQLWSIAADGTGETPTGDLGTFRPIDVFIDVSTTGLLTWAPIQPGQPQLWTATIK